MTDTADPIATIDDMIPSAPVFDSIEQEREHRKQRLASVFRVFSKFGFEEGVAGCLLYTSPSPRDRG